MHTRARMVLWVMAVEHGASAVWLCFVSAEKTPGVSRGVLLVLDPSPHLPLQHPYIGLPAGRAEVTSEQLNEH